MDRSRRAKESLSDLATTVVTSTLVQGAKGLRNVGGAAAKAGKLIEDALDKYNKATERGEAIADPAC